MELQELDYDHSIHERDRAGDDRLYVRFYKDVVPDEEATKAAGMRKFRDVDMIQIVVPGDKRNIVVREVRDDDKVRFEKYWGAYSQGVDEQVSGFPLSEWSMITRAIVEELKYLGFRTVEQLANASEASLGKYPGMRELQRRAKTWLESQLKAAPIEKMNAELETRDKQIQALQAQVQALMKPDTKAK